MGARIVLLRMLLRRDLDARYKATLLGKLWPFVTQAFQIALYTYVFSTIMRQQVDVPGFGNSKLSFGVWLFTGLLPWIAFSGGLTTSASAVVSQPNFVKKIVFPLALLPVVPVITALIESCFGLVPLLILVVAISHRLHPTILLLPVVWFFQILLTAGFGYIAAALTVYLRDVPQTLAIILNIWFYFTPIVYPTTAIPILFRRMVQFANPLTCFVDVYRDLILNGQVHQWSEIIDAASVSLLIFLLGLYFYRRLQVAFADVL